MIAASLILAAAFAAAPERQVRCDVVDGDVPVRHFSVWFTPANGDLKGVKVDETNRIFTPGNVVATWSTRTGVSSIPDKRPGKWSGVAEGGAFRFTLKASDGSAGFVLTPDAAKPGSYGLTWTADRTDPRFGDTQKANGTGTCADINSGTAQ